MILDKIEVFMREKGFKIYFAGVALLMMTFISTPAYAACTTDQSWLSVLGTLVQDPVKWIMYISGTTTVLFTAYGGLLVRGARGRQDKVDKAMDFFKWFVGGSILIFGASGLGTWFMSKFTC